MTLTAAMHRDRLTQACATRALPRSGRVTALWRVLLAALVLLPALAAPGRAQAPGAATGDAAEAPRRVVVRFLTEGDYPPFNYYDDDGVLTGFNVDLARAICLELSAACDIKVRPWEELMAGLKRSDADAVIAGHAVTAHALDEADFSDRYFYTPGRFAGRTDSPETEISPEGLDRRTIAVAKGTAHEAFLKAFFRDSRLQVYDNQDLAREALQQGKADFVFDDAIGLSFWLNGSLSRKCCAFRGGPYFEPKYFGGGIAIVLAKGDPEIKTLINSALERVRQSGRFQELVERYFPLKVF